MSSQPYLSYNEAGGVAPFTIGLAAGVDIVMASVTAVWDGGGAAGTFKPCLSLYSQAGQLLSRSFPSTLMEGGDSGEVTYAPFLGLGGRAGGGISDVAFAGILGTGVNLVAPYDEDITWSGTFATNDPSTYENVGDTIRMKKTGTYFASAIIKGWDTTFVDTRFEIRQQLSGGNNPVLWNDTVLQSVPYAGDTVQMFDIFQMGDVTKAWLTLHGASASEDFINANADHSLIVWRMGEYLGWTGFD